MTEDVPSVVGDDGRMEAVIEQANPGVATAVGHEDERHS